MNEWIQRSNLAIFRRLIAAEEDGARRQEIEQILDEEEARLERRVSENLGLPAEVERRKRA